MGHVVVVINGKGGVGKDTLCDYVLTKVPGRKITSIQPVLDILKDTNLFIPKDKAGRKLLSDLKNAFDEYGRLSDGYIIKEIDTFASNITEEVLFVHIREPKQIKSITKYCNDNNVKCETCLVKRKEIDSKVYGNSSDDNVDNYKYDITFDNDDDLEVAGGKFYRAIFYPTNRLTTKTSLGFYVFREGVSLLNVLKRLGEYEDADKNFLE